MRTKPPRSQSSSAIATTSSDSGSGDGDEPIYVKLAVIGDMGVGKTSMLRRIVEEDESKKFGATTTTIGVDCRPIWIKSNHPHYNVKTSVTLIDTAGQERYRAVVSSMFTTAQGVFFLFDATKEATFASLCNEWVPLVAERNTQCVRVLVATQYDLYEQLEQDKRWMDGIDMDAQAKLLGCDGGFHAISAKTGRHVDAMLMQIVDRAITKERWLMENSLAYAASAAAKRDVIVIGTYNANHVGNKNCSC